MMTAFGPHRVLAPNFLKGSCEEGGSFINLSQACDFWRPETLFLKQLLIYYDGCWLNGPAPDTCKSMQQQALSPSSPYFIRGSSALGQHLPVACDTHGGTSPSTVNNYSHQVVHAIQIDGVAGGVEEPQLQGKHDPVGQLRVPVQLLHVLESLEV